MMDGPANCKYVQPVSCRGLRGAYSHCIVGSMLQDLTKVSSTTLSHTGKLVRRASMVSVFVWGGNDVHTVVVLLLNDHV